MVISRVHNHWQLTEEFERTVEFEFEKFRPVQSPKTEVLPINSDSLGPWLCALWA